MSISITHGMQGPYTLQRDAVSGAGEVMDCTVARGFTFHVTGSAGVTGGAVLLETAPDPAFAGTWAPVGAPVAVVPGDTVVTVDGLFAFLRVRITQPIVGGTVTVTALVTF